MSKVSLVFSEAEITSFPNVPGFAITVPVSHLDLADLLCQLPDEDLEVVDQWLEENFRNNQ